MPEVPDFLTMALKQKNKEGVSLNDTIRDVAGKVQNGERINDADHENFTNTVNGGLVLEATESLLNKKQETKEYGNDDLERIKQEILRKLGNS